MSPGRDAFADALFPGAVVATVVPGCVSADPVGTSVVLPVLPTAGVVVATSPTPDSGFSVVFGGRGIRVVVVFLMVTTVGAFVTAALLT